MNKQLHLAMYKGPAKGWFKQLWHRLVCAVTKSQYSHCELVLVYEERGQSVCASASNRDGGVRRNLIELWSGRWDVFPIANNPTFLYDQADTWFWEHQGDGYDYLGLLYFLVPLRLGSKSKWFCSEACAAALGLPEPHTYSPQGLLDVFLARAALAALLDEGMEAA